MKVDLIIPTYKPDSKFVELIALMQSQTVPINQIIIINTEQKFYDSLAYSNKLLNDYRNMTVKHISRTEFDHGRTRNMAVKLSDADYFIMMTQDAVPVSTNLVENLLKGFETDESVAVTYARQVARSDAKRSESYTRIFNYPVESSTKSKADESTLGIKAYFCSNVCAMYKRKVFDELGGFENHVIFNEDMLFAREAIVNGYRIRYQADAQVVHSHNYTNREYYKRNFDIGVSHATHPEIFEGLNTKGEGLRLVKATASHLSKSGHILDCIGLYITSAYKYLGYRRGKHFERLSHSSILKKTMNPGYWREERLLKDRGTLNARLGYGRSKEELEMINKPVLPNNKDIEQESTDINK